jgi:hypothetical protein
LTSLTINLETEIACWQVEVELSPNLTTQLNLGQAQLDIDSRNTCILVRLEGRTAGQGIHVVQRSTVQGHVTG